MNPIIDGILVMEGGYTNNPKDKGGATNWGSLRQRPELMVIQER